MNAAKFSPTALSDGWTEMGAVDGWLTPGLLGTFGTCHSPALLFY